MVDFRQGPLEERERTIYIIYLGMKGLAIGYELCEIGEWPGELHPLESYVTWTSGASPKTQSLQAVSIRSANVQEQWKQRLERVTILFEYWISLYLPLSRLTAVPDSSLFAKLTAHAKICRNRAIASSQNNDRIPHQTNYCKWQDEKCGRMKAFSRIRIASTIRWYWLTSYME